MKRCLKIAIDCDDVLVPTGSGQIAFYNRTYNAMVTEKEFYDTATIDIWGTDDDQVAIDRVAEHTLSDDFANTLPMPEAVEAIHRLARDHELHLVTGRPSTIEHATKRLLDRHFSGCFTTVQHTNYYTYSWDKAKKRSKAEVCQEVGADLFIDDYIGHIRDVSQAGVCDVILFGNYGWSKLNDSEQSITRCLNWRAVEKEIEAYAHRPEL